jgi:hypothetical protein
MTIRLVMRCMVILASLLAGSRSAVAADVGALESAVKATYLYKFEAFVKWPAAAFASPSSPFVLCVVDDAPFAAAVDKAVSGQHIGDRAFEIRHLETVTANSGCHIMYIGGSGTQSVAQALEIVRGAAILTITDSADDANAQGIIGFMVQDNKVRFQIDDGAASRSGITISAELLKLALSVKPRS